MRAPFQKFITILIPAILIASSNSTWAQSVSLRPALEKEMEPSRIGGKNVFAFGLYAEAALPFKNHYTQVGPADGKLAYQAPVGMGMDFSWGLGRKTELGLVFGYEKFESRATARVQSSSEDYEEVSIRSFPVMLVGRYRWPKKYIAPELELGAGANFSKITVTSTIDNSSPVTQNQTIPRGHLGFGVAYAWGIDLTIHFQMGYRLAIFPETNFTESSGQFIVTQSRLSHGVYSKGSLRFQF